MLFVNLGVGRRKYKQFGMADEIFHLLMRAAASEKEVSGVCVCIYALKWAEVLDSFFNCKLGKGKCKQL